MSGLDDGGGLTVSDRTDIEFQCWFLGWICWTGCNLMGGTQLVVSFSFVAAGQKLFDPDAQTNAILLARWWVSHHRLCNYKVIPCCGVSSNSSCYSMSVLVGFSIKIYKFVNNTFCISGLRECSIHN